MEGEEGGGEKWIRWLPWWSTRHHGRQPKRGLRGELARRHQGLRRQKASGTWAAARIHLNCQSIELSRAQILAAAVDPFANRRAASHARLVRLYVIDHFGREGHALDFPRRCLSFLAGGQRLYKRLCFKRPARQPAEPPPAAWRGRAPFAPPRPAARPRSTGRPAHPVARPPFSFLCRCRARAGTSVEDEPGSAAMDGGGRGHSRHCCHLPPSAPSPPRCWPQWRGGGGARAPARPSAGRRAPASGVVGGGV